MKPKNIPKNAGGGSGWPGGGSIQNTKENIATIKSISRS